MNARPHELSGPVIRASIHLVAVTLVWALVLPSARADTRCTGGVKSGDRFATCFDMGNRLVLSATTEGYGGGIQLRHVLTFDDEPDLTWRLDHGIAIVRVGGVSRRYGGVAYSGRYIRHARDGHIVLPFATERKMFVPFDIGAEAEAGRVSGELGSSSMSIGVVRVTALIDLARSQNFRRRLSLGPVLAWDIGVDRDEISIAEHTVTPFTVAAADGYAESASGLTAVNLRIQWGREWSTDAGWRTALGAEVFLERIVLAINDRPLSVVLGVRYRAPADDEVVGEVGVRFAMFQRAHRQVNLNPLQASR